MSPVPRGTADFIAHIFQPSLRDGLVENIGATVFRYGLPWSCAEKLLSQQFAPCLRADVPWFVRSRAASHARGPIVPLRYE